MLNSLIGHKILPIKVTHCTSKVCRIRDSQTLSVSVLNDEDDKNHCTFETIKDMATYLRGIASNEGNKTPYVDISLPLPLIEV